MDSRSAKRPSLWIAISSWHIYQSAGYPDADVRMAVPRRPVRIIRTAVRRDARAMPQYVRDVLVSGLHATRKRLVDPLISLHPGDPLSWTEMGDMQRHLYNLGVFDTVDMAIQNPGRRHAQQVCRSTLRGGPPVHAGRGRGRRDCQDRRQRHEHQQSHWRHRICARDSTCNSAG